GHTADAVPLAVVRAGAGPRRCGDSVDAEPPAALAHGAGHAREHRRRRRPHRLLRGPGGGAAAQRDWLRARHGTVAAHRDAVRPGIERTVILPVIDRRGRMEWINEETSSGVTERRFDLDVDGENVPGILWAPENATGTRPLVLL